jgi:hypothetical protein
VDFYVSPFSPILGEIARPTLIRSPHWPGLPELSKTIHTPRHKKLCELLKARRKAAGLTHTFLADRLGKPPSYVAKYEGGDRRLDVLEFLDIAAAIGFEPCRLIRALLGRKSE